MSRYTAILRRGMTGHAPTRHRWLLVLLILLALPLTSQAQEQPTCETLAPADVSATYYLGLGDAYITQGDYTRAIIAYTCGIDREPNVASAYLSRGIAHAAQFNGTQALADYNRALELDANLLAAYNNRGLLYSQEANYGLAIADFTLLTSLAPDYAPAYHNRALVHAAEGNYDLAIQDLQQAIALDPTYAAPNAALSAVYLALAAQSYTQYESVRGQLAPTDVNSLLRSVQAAQQTGDPSVWFSLATPMR